MSTTRIKLPFVRTYADSDAETAIGMLQVAFLKKDIPPKPYVKVDVHIFCAPAEEKGTLGILTLVLESLDGLAWENREQLRTVIVQRGEGDEGMTPTTDIWISWEDGDERRY